MNKFNQLKILHQSEDIDDDLFKYWKEEDFNESDAKLLAKTELRLDDFKFLSEKELEVLHLVQ
eukprot:gene11556-4807_t